MSTNFIIKTKISSCFAIKYYFFAKVLDSNRLELIFYFFVIKLPIWRIIICDLSLRCRADSLDLFDSKIALRYDQNNFGVKKVSAPSKSPLKCHIICCTQKKFSPGLSNSAIQ
jgi:hypothetical protein